MRDFIKYVCISLWFCTVAETTAQESVMDSLLSVLKTAKEDTNKVNLLYQLSEKCESQEDILLYAEQSLALAQKLGYKKGIANAFNNIGYVYDNLGQIQKALEYYSGSLKLQEELNNKDGIAAALTNVASIYNSQLQREKALEYNLRALKIHKETGNKLGISNCLNNIGSISTLMGKREKALEYYFQALEIQKEIDDKNGMAFSLINIGSNYSKQGNTKAAIEFFLKSLAIRKETNNPRGIAMCLNGLASIYLSTKDYKSAEAYCLRALRLADSTRYPVVISRSSGLLSEIYAAEGKYQKAFEMHVLFKKMADSLRNEETQNASLSKQMQYEFEKKEAATLLEQEKKDAVALEEAQKQRVILWSVLGGLLIVIVFTGFILNRWNITRRQKKIIEVQKALVDRKNMSITDSINYAERIQRAILPKEDFFKEVFADYFIFYKPKEIVSGDFYWAERRGDKIIFAAVDCTGHGIPGAFMSMIGNTLLNQIVNEQGIVESNHILDHLKQGVIHALKESDEVNTQKDGMEIALCVFEKNKNILSFSGAYNSLYHFRKDVFTEYESDKQTIGFERGKNEPFTKHTIQVQPQDSVYIFSDGFPDQKGGVDERKYYYKPFQQLLASVQHLTMAEQKAILLKTLNDWKRHLEQVDDILIIGVRI